MDTFLRTKFGRQYDGFLEVVWNSMRQLLALRTKQDARKHGVAAAPTMTHPPSASMLHMNMEVLLEAS